MSLLDFILCLIAFLLGCLAGHVDFFYNRVHNSYSILIRTYAKALLGVCYSIDEKDYAQIAARYYNAAETVVNKEILDVKSSR
jgi:hypothetical protein